MKLDKHKFARLIGYICVLSGKDIAQDDVDYIDRIVDINIEPVSTGFVEAEKVDELLRCMQERLKGGLIPAIKAYRALTNVGLKEGKDAIERYCVIFPVEKS